MSVEETARHRWAAFEPIRIRIMQEAYDCADRNEAEAYNSIKVMCGEVLRLAEEMVSTEREACAKVLDEMADQMVADMEPSPAINWVRNRAAAIRARGQA